MPFILGTISYILQHQGVLLRKLNYHNGS